MRNPDATLAGLDVPLLLALKELLDSASVTAAARTLGRTQPSMSRTLTRLREMFDDPLLVAVGRRLEPTLRARELRPALDQVLDGLRGLLEPARPFSPSKARRVVRIAASDYAIVVLLHPWIARLRSVAPGVIVQVTPIDANSVDPLARGDLDLAIGPRLPAAGLDQFVFRKILEDRLVCMLRRGHPKARRKLTLRGYLALEHVMVASVLPTVSSIDVALHRLGHTRVIAARMPSVLAAVMLAADTDLAATSFARIRAHVGDRLVESPLPFEVEPLVLHLIWHPRSTMDPFHRWLRESLAGPWQPKRSGTDPRVA